MYSPGQIKSKLANLTDRFKAEGKEADKSVAWFVIHSIENCWRTRPVKERTANRRSVLRYLFGVDSTKELASSQLLALHKWMTFSAERESELRACLTAALVDAGQLELA